MSIKEVRIQTQKVIQFAFALFLLGMLIGVIVAYKQ